MTHRLSNRCRVEKRKFFFSASSSFPLDPFSVYDHWNNAELASTVFFFFPCSRPKRVSTVQTRTHHQLDEWSNHVEKSIQRNGSYEWTKWRAMVPKWQFFFFFFRLVRVVLSFGTMIWKLGWLWLSLMRRTMLVFKMRHTYVCHGVQSLSRPDTSLHMKTKKKEL